MKPWEETWLTDDDGESVRRVGDEDQVARVDPDIDLSGDAGRESRVARARLASAAPDMARALLEIEYSGENFGEPCCPSCGAAARYCEVGSEEEQAHAFEASKRPHAPSCAIEAALRKAGIR